MRKIQHFSYDGKITEQTYKRKRLTIDFFHHQNLNGRTYTYSYIKFDDVHYENESYFSVASHELPLVCKFKRVRVNGHCVRIPLNHEEYLQREYGDGWKIPNPDWQENQNQYRIVENKKGIKIAF